MAERRVKLGRVLETAGGRGRGRRALIVVGLLLTLAGSCALALRAGVSTLSRLAEAVAPAALAQSVAPPSSPSKEYVYAGDRLVATEDPALGPSNLRYIHMSQSGSTVYGYLQWNDNTSDETGFIVESRTAITGGWSAWSQLAQVGADVYRFDLSISGGAINEYRVKAVTNSNSGYSNTVRAIGPHCRWEPENDLIYCWSYSGCDALPSTLIISKFRLRGPAGARDEFVELYNNTDSAINVCTSDGSGGWTVAARNASGTSTSPVFTIPDGTVIPARGRYLAVNVSPGGYRPSGDITYTADIEDDSGIALFDTANTAAFTADNRVDAVGFRPATGAIADFYREGTGLVPAGPQNIDLTFVRKQGASAAALQDTDNNWSDFIPPVTGSLSGGFTAQTAPVNLTSQGTLDWAHWGRGGVPGFDHKAGVAQQIGNYSVLGSAAPSSYGDLAYSHTWTDGTPSAGATATTGVFVNGAVGNGFRITVAADTNVRTLRLYVGAWCAQGQLRAQLSDGSAPDYTGASFSSSSGTKNFVYTISYKAASAGQTLTVSYTMLNEYNDGLGNVTLQAATLMAGTPPPPPANAADFVSQSAPTIMTSGLTYNVSVKVRNTGANTWAAASSYKLGAQNPQDNSTWGLARVALAAAVRTGEEITFNFAVTAPQVTSATTYNFQWRMVQDGVEWFGAYTANVTVTVSPPANTGSLSGTIAAQTANVNLTSEGASDWAHWGRGGTSGFNHKAGVTQQISNFTLLGSTAPMSLGGLAYSLSWTDGTPTASASSAQYVSVSSFVGNGFRITVPADTNVRTLRLYVGASYSQGKLQAQLSDSSAPTYTDTSVSAPSGMKNFVYTISYKASSANQWLTVSYTMASGYNGSSSTVNLQAATLKLGTQQASLSGTSEGTLEWAHMGRGTDAAFDCGAGVARQSGEYSVLNSATPASYGELANTISSLTYGYGGLSPAATVRAARLNEPRQGVSALAWLKRPPRERDPYPLACTPLLAASRPLG